MNQASGKESSVLVTAEPVASRDYGRVSHLAAHRPLIVRRALLAATLPFMTGRVRAGLFMKLAHLRGVDLPQRPAEALAGRQVALLMAPGRGSGDTATTFQMATLFDHYCARMHVGGGIDPAAAGNLRGVMLATVGQVNKTQLVSGFQEGAKVLSRSVLEAPGWASARMTALVERWITTKGTPDAASPELSAPSSVPSGDERWLDRAARAVEDRLGHAVDEHVFALVDDFEGRMRNGPGADPNIDHRPHP